MKKMIAALVLTASLWSAAWADPTPLQTGNSSYNCHGFTFTGGNAVVDQFATTGENDNVGDVIQADYEPIENAADAQPGDIIVYDGPNTPSHTGIVVGVENGVPVVVSKFGQEGDLNLHVPGEYGNATAKDWKIYRRDDVQPDPEAGQLSQQLLQARASGDTAAVRDAAGKLLPRLQRQNYHPRIRLHNVSYLFREDGGTAGFYVVAPIHHCGNL